MSHIIIAYSFSYIQYFEYKETYLDVALFGHVCDWLNQCHWQSLFIKFPTALIDMDTGTSILI